MPQFIKTSKGFINLDHIDTVTATDKVCIGLANSETGLWFQGDEAKALKLFFYDIIAFDATKATIPEPLDFDEDGQLVYSDNPQPIDPETAYWQARQEALETGQPFDPGKHNLPYLGFVAVPEDGMTEVVTELRQLAEAM